MASTLNMMQQGTDDEGDEELAALRQAALMSRKSTTKEINKFQNSVITTNKPIYQKNSYTYINDKHHLNNFGAHRLGYNKPKWRNSNLIVINTVPLDEKSVVQSSVPKLLLPQDRWCPLDNPQKMEPVSPKGPKKFSRIRSNSDSESDYEDTDSEANSDILDKNSGIDDTKDSLVDDGESLLLSEEEINADNSQGMELPDPDAALLEDELNLHIKPIDDAVGEILEETRLQDEDTLSQDEETAEQSVEDEFCDENSNDSVTSRPNSAASDENSVQTSEEVCSEGDLEEELLQDDDERSLPDSDLGSCASIELEHLDFDTSEAQLPPEFKGEPLRKKPKVKITMKTDIKSKNAQEITILTTKEVLRSPKSDNLDGDKRLSTEKAPIDLRLLLKAKRGQKMSPDQDSRDSLRSESPDSPVVRSVLSVVKPFQKRRRDKDEEDWKVRRDKKFEGTNSVGSGSVNKVRLLQLKADSARVTVVTDNDREEKKSSVHNRLGPYAAKPSRSTETRRMEERDTNAHSRLSRTVVVSQKISTKQRSLLKKSLDVELLRHSETNSRSSSESSSTSSRRRSASSSSSKRISYSSRNRKSGHQSGLNNVKEIQLDAKIRKIQAFNAAILKRQEEIEADIKRYAN